MAIIGTDRDEQDPNAPPGAAGTPGTGGSANSAPPVTGGGAGGAFIGGGTGQGATTTTKAPTSSGNYTNLTDYLSANQGSGATMGKTAENVVGQAGQDADNKLVDYSNNTTRAINAGTPGVDQGVLGQINNGITTGASTTTKNADGSTTTTGGKQSYNGFTPATASYTGPTATSNVTGQAGTDQAGAYGAISKLVGGAPGSGTYNGGLVRQAGDGQTGVQSLLRNNVYQQPSYTAGESGLDAFLTGGTPGGQQSLKNIQDQWGGMGAKGDATNARLTTAMQGGIDAATGVNKTYGDAVKAATAQAQAYNPTSTTTAAPGPIAPPLSPPPPPPSADTPAPAAGGKNGNTATVATNAAKGLPAQVAKIAAPAVKSVAPAKAVNAGTPIATGFTPDQMAAFAKAEANTLANSQPVKAATAPNVATSAAPSNPVMGGGGYQSIVNAVTNPVGAAGQNAGQVLTGKKKLW